MIFKVLYVHPQSGEHGRLPDYGITNIGGTAGPTFYVGGKPLLFADGTATDGSNSALLSTTLQGSYNVSTPATIDLTVGKHLTFNAVNSKIFQFNADTGKVTITGDLEVQGTSTVIEGILTNVDQVSITPPDGVTSALLIEPGLGVTMASDLVRIRGSNAGASVFTIDAAGDTFIRTLTVGTTLNVGGVDFTQFYNDFVAHTTASPAPKHTAAEIAVAPALSNLPGDDVQEVLESINVAVTGLAASIRTHEHIQSSPMQIWTIVHAQNSMRPTVTIYNTDNYQVLPDEVHILDPNTIQVHFNTPALGRAILIMF